MKQCLVCLGIFSTATLVDGHESHEPVVYIDQEPSHRVVLHNDVFRTFDVTIEPGARSLFHLHDKDSVLACLDGAEVPSEEPNKPIIQRPAIRSGQVYYRAYSQEPFVHRIQNLSATRFRILDIEILSDPLDQSTLGFELAPLPGNVSTVLENSRTRVSRLTLNPDYRSGAFKFRGPHLFVFMSDGAVNIDSEAAVEEFDARRGQLHYMARAQETSIKNSGRKDMDILVVEVKRR